MNDSPPELRQERDPSHTRTSTPNACGFDRRKFLYVLGGGLIMSVVSCAPSQITIVENAGSQAEGADIPAVNFPEGVLKLSVTAPDGTPVGVLKQGGRVYFFVGEDRCELLEVARGDQSFSLNDTLVDGTKTGDAITSIGLSEDKALVAESDFGSIAIDTEAQERVAEILREQIQMIRAQGVVVPTPVFIEDVAYELETKGLGTAAYLTAELLGKDTPPRKGGTCKLFISVLPNEEATGEGN